MKELSKVSEELGFVIEVRSGMDIIVYNEGGCRPASGAEVTLFNLYLKMRSNRKEIVGYMKSVPGGDEFSMFVNEQPDGGFEWKFLDFEPSDPENYKKIYISVEKK